MYREKEMFNEALEFLEKHYNDKNFDKITAEVPEICKRYKGSGLWQNLILAVLDHLEAKAKYEARTKDEPKKFKSP